METFRATKAEALEKADAAERGPARQHAAQGRSPAAGCAPDEAGPLPRSSRRGRSGGRLRHRTHPGRQVDRPPYRRDHGLRHPAGPSRRQPGRPGRSAHRRRPAAEQFHPERRSADRGRREEGRRRREGPVAGGGGLGAVRPPRGDGEGLHAGFRLGGGGGQVAGRATAPSTPCSWPRWPAPAASPPAWPSAWCTSSALQAFGYHMWTEVYVDKRWIPVDATLAAGGIGAAHLKIAQSNLQGASAFSRVPAGGPVDRAS